MSRGKNTDTFQQRVLDERLSSSGVSGVKLVASDIDVSQPDDIDESGSAGDLVDLMTKRPSQIFVRGRAECYASIKGLDMG